MSAYINNSDTILICYLGYLDKKIALKDFIERKSSQITLTPSNTVINEVVIKDYLSRGISISKESDNILLSPRKMIVNSGITPTDVLNIVGQLPGVNNLNESVSNIHIHGGTPDQNLILWEDITLYSTGHFFGILSSFNSGSVENISVSKDFFKSEYGGRSSGVVNMKGVNNIPKNTKASIGANLLHADFLLEVPITNRAAVFVSGCRSFYDVANNMSFKNLSKRVFQDSQIAESDNDILQKDIDVNYYNFASKILFKGNDYNFSASAYKSTDNHNFVVHERYNSNIFIEEDDINVDNYGFNTMLNYNQLGLINGKISYSLSKHYSNSTFDTSIKSNPFFYKNQYENGVSDRTFLTVNTIDINSSNNLRFGYELKNIDIDYDIKYLSNYEYYNGEDKKDEQQKHHSVFLEYNTKLGKKVNLTSGFRYTFKNQTTPNFFEPRLLFSADLFNSITFKIRAGLYKQYLNQIIEINDRNLTERIWKFVDNNNSNLLLTKSFSSGLQYSKYGFQIEFDAYYKKSTDINIYSFHFIQQESTNLIKMANSRTKGFDILFKKNIGLFNLWSCYTYSVTDLFLNEGKYNEEIIPAPHDQRHKLDVTLQFKKNNLELSGSWQYNSGKPYTKVDKIIEEETENYIYYFMGYTQVNDSRFPDFHSLNFSAMYNIKLSKKLNTKIGLSVLNITNRNNQYSTRNFITFDKNDNPKIIDNQTFLMNRFFNISVRLLWN